VPLNPSPVPQQCLAERRRIMAGYRHYLSDYC
jgi:hypothetical protein